jgi:hypothetical protein
MSFMSTTVYLLEAKGRSPAAPDGPGGDGGE